MLPIGYRGCTVEFRGIAKANHGGFEVGLWDGKDAQGSHGTIGFASEGDGAGVVAAHAQGAVFDNGVLKRGGKTIGSRPAIGGSGLSYCRQMDGLAEAVRPVVVDQGRQNAAVGGAGALVLEIDVAGLVRKVGD